METKDDASKASGADTVGGSPAAPPPATDASSAIADAAAMAPPPPAEPAATVAPPDDELAAKLTEFGATDEVIAAIKEELGATTMADLTLLTEADLTGVGMKPIPARNLLKDLAPAKPMSEMAGSGLMGLNYDDVLPPVPSNESWLKALQVGGVLKVDQSTVISAVHTALAHRAGLYDVPALLVTAMEKFADITEEQVDPEFFKLRKQLTRRNYPEIFEAIDGLDGNFVTDGRKKQLLGRVDENLWPAIVSFQNQLVAWQESWMGPGTQAMMMTNILAALASGGGVPPGIMQPPDTGVLHDYADAVADAASKVFRGTGVQIAAAMAYDAGKINETLQNPRLPAMIGAANRDMMLRQLGVAVSSAYARLETGLTRYVLSVLQVKDMSGGMEEVRFCGAIYILGTQIAWDQLGGASVTDSPTGLGGRTRKEL